jgi:hypothetical protein
METSQGATPDAGALTQLRAQVLVGWHEFPRLAELDAVLSAALARAAATPVAVLTITNPVSRPLRVRLATLANPTSLDAFYGGEAAELSVSADGVCYLIYRRSDGGDYGVEWSSATLMPSALMLELPEVLASAMFDGRD